MSTKIVYQYRVYCIEEATYVTLWGETEPTLCPNNHADRTINSSSTTIIDKINIDTVKAEEPTYGYFQSKSLEFNIPAGATGDVSTFDESWVSKILLWRSIFYINSENLGDVINVQAGPNTTIGVITAALSPGETVITANSTVFDYLLYRGLHVRITDGVNIDALGEVTNIDKENFQFTVSTATTNSFAIGSYIQLTICSIQNLKLTQIGNIKVANKGFKGQSVEPGQIMRLNYTNNDGLAKTINLRLEYYLQE